MHDPVNHPMVELAHRQADWLVPFAIRLVEAARLDVDLEPRLLTTSAIKELR